MKYERIIGGELESNGYILYQNRGGDALIIDPGYNGSGYVAYIRENDLNLRGILLTHMHYDHVGAVRKIISDIDCPVYMHPQDAQDYRGRVDVLIENGYTIKLEGEPIIVLHTPGHTRGSVCFYCPESRICFTGDTVFDTDLGRTDLFGGSERAMERSIRDVVDKWSNDIFILPGHEDGCSMASVRKNNYEFRQIVNGTGRGDI